MPRGISFAGDTNRVGFLCNEITKMKITGHFVLPLVFTFIRITPYLTAFLQVTSEASLHPVAFIGGTIFYPSSSLIPDQVSLSNLLS